MTDMNWALVVPLANEENEFDDFASVLARTLDLIGNGHVYFVVDGASKDNTLAAAQLFSGADHRFRVIWAPENRNVVDAYLRGYRAACQNGHEFIVEMDAGLSHDPAALLPILGHLGNGYECVYGSRFIDGGGGEWNARRKFLSKGGTLLANALLGTTLRDMTSGYQGFSRPVVERFIAYPLKSRAHFYQTELKYLLRRYRTIEVPITYRAPSPSVSSGAVSNSFAVLGYYSWKRFTFRAVTL